MPIICPDIENPLWHFYDPINFYSPFFLSFSVQNILQPKLSEAHPRPWTKSSFAVIEKKAANKVMRKEARWIKRKVSWRTRWENSFCSTETDINEANSSNVWRSFPFFLVKGKENNAKKNNISAYHRVAYIIGVSTERFISLHRYTTFSSTIKIYFPPSVLGIEILSPILLRKDFIDFFLSQSFRVFFPPISRTLSSF